MRPRRGRALAYRGWWTVWVAAAIVLLNAIMLIGDPARWPLLIASLVSVAFVIAVALLAESSIALARTRQRGVERVLAGTRRERDLLVDHWARLLVVTTELDPEAAARASAAMNLDLHRLYAMGQHVSTREHRDVRTDPR